MDQIKKDLANADPFKSWWPFIIAVAVGIIATIRTLMGGQKCPNTNKIDNQIVIVTGATGGIGNEICKELCSRFGHIIMACKDMEKAEKLLAGLKKTQPNAKIDARYLDLRSFDCIKRFVNTIEKEYERVDILINNAGLMFHPYEKTSDGFEMHLQCNYLGHFLLTTLLLPLLKKSKQGRIINVSAHAHASGKMDIEDPLNIGTWAPTFHPRDAFAHSKLAVLLATKYIAKMLKESSCTTNSCTPGLVRGTGHLDRSPIMKALCAKVITYPWMWLFMKTPSQGAQTIIHLATDIKLRDISGEYFNDCEIAEPSEIGKDEQLAEKLVKETLKVLKLDIAAQLK